MKQVLMFCLLSISCLFSNSIYADSCEGWKASSSIPELDGRCYLNPPASMGALCSSLAPEPPGHYIVSVVQEIMHRTTGAGIPYYSIRCYNLTLYETEPPGSEPLPGSQDSMTLTFNMCPEGYAPTEDSCVLDCDNGKNSELAVCNMPKEKECEDEAGNPINFVTGNKTQVEVDFETLGPVNSLSFIRYYNSHGNKERKGGSWVAGDDIQQYFTIERFTKAPIHDPALAPTNTPFTIIQESESFFIEDNDPETNTQIEVTVPTVVERFRSLGSLDKRWRNNFDKVLWQRGNLASVVFISRPNGDELVFERTSTTSSLYLPHDRTTQSYGKVVKQVDMWVYYTPENNVELYDKNGKYLSLITPTGYRQDMVYNNQDLLISVNDSLGRTMSFTYDGNYNIATMTDPLGNVTSYFNSANGLVLTVIYPDGNPDPYSGPTRQYRYEDIRFPEALTGIEDDGVRYATFAYQANGYAISTEHAGGADKLTIDYSVSSQRKLTNALGKSTIYTYDSTGNHILSIEGEASPNCAATTASYTYDNNNFRTSKTDRNGNVTTYQRDEFGREISRTEAFGTPLARTISTQWHPDLNVKTKVTEPERITDYSYDANGLLLNRVVTPNLAQ